MLKGKSLAGALSLFLILLLVNTCSANSGGETVVVFQDGKTAVKYPESNGQTTPKTPSAFSAPSFIGGMINSKEFLAIISLGNVGESSSKDYTDGVVKIRYGDDKEWTEAEMFKTLQKTGDSQAPWGDTTAVMKEKKIYVLITSMGDANSDKTLHDPLMIVGNVANCTTDNIKSVCIKWEEATSLTDKISKTVQWTEASKFMGGEGNGIVTTNGKIIFPIVIIKNGKKIASILYSDDGDKWHIGGETESGTSDGSLVEWSNGKLLFTVASEDGLWKVFESEDFGIKWIPSPIFFGVWGNGENHKGKETPGSFIAVPVHDKNVLVFAYPQNKGKKKNNLNTLELWLSDGQRITCVGTISDESKEENTGHSVLAYVGENLYVTHQINPSGLSNQDTTQTKDTWNKVIGLTPLTELFEKVKTTVLAWRNLDDNYKGKGIPTDALVGFFRNTKADDATVWPDMYNCVNATVTGGKSVDGSFSFNGAAGSGAKWPVSSQGQNQVYKFTETQFTLATTIIIQKEITAEGVSVIGAIADDKENSLLFDIGHTKEKKWYARKKDSQKIDTGVSVVLEKEHQFVITFEKKTLSVYIDGVEAANAKQNFENEFLIDHFFFGRTGTTDAKDNGGSFTVKNVMLFSQALNQREITDLGKVKEIPPLSEPIQPEEEIIPTAKPKVHSKTISTSLPEKRESQPTVELKEASQFVDNDVTNAIINKTETINPLSEYRNAAIPKDAKIRKDAAMSLSVVHVMCLVCFLVALARF